MSHFVNGIDLPDMPWQEKPAGWNLPVWRYSENPVIKRNPFKGMGRIFNSAVVPYKGAFVGVFRGETTTGRPFLYLGHSADGISWQYDEEKISMVDEQGKTWNPLYAYDPRCVLVDGQYYLIWCGDFDGASLGIARTSDFKTFVRLENPFLPFNRNGVLFPRKINGEYVLLSRPSDSGHTPFGDVFLSRSPDLTFWGKHRLVMSKGGSGWWQAVKIGCGPAPLETDEGWLVFYHGVTGTCSGFVYSIGAALLDRDCPSKVLYRSGRYLLTPEESYETSGFVPNVTFPVAALADQKTGRIALYYGAADTVVALAFCQLDEVIAYIKENNELVAGDGDEGRF
ncbi:MAG: glycoside hydrolase family 130 protein [Treponema sp.]|nr:glycoside hydrolase family 130 protein [Treponema sp.]